MPALWASTSAQQSNGQHTSETLILETSSPPETSPAKIASLGVIYMSYISSDRRLIPNNVPEFAWDKFRISVRLLLLAAFSLLLHSLLSIEVKAATLPTNFIETQFASGFTNPTAMAFAPDGRLFVCQQNGQLRVYKNGALLATPFVTLTVDSNGERGLLGVAFDPNFATNQFVYVYYTATTPATHNRVSRFTASMAN